MGTFDVGHALPGVPRQAGDGLPYAMAAGENTRQRPESYTILPNRLSSSLRVSTVNTGRPWGQ